MNNNQNIVIDKVDINDLSDIYSFVSLLEKKSFDKKKFKKIFSENISSENNIYLIARIEKVAVGFISCHSQYLLHHCSLIGEIQELFVTESYRNLGIGQSLINSLKVILIEKGINQLEVTSNLKRDATKLFYENSGFINTHRKFVINLKTKKIR